MSKFKKITVICLIISLLFGLIGCKDNKPGAGTDGEDGVNTEKSVTLRFMHIWPEHAKAMKELADVFMSKNKNITIDISFVPFTDINKTIQAAYDGGTMPDVFFLWTHDMYKWVPDKVVADISDIYQETKADFVDNGQSWEIGRVDNKYYNAPFRATGYLVAYNKTIFDKYGFTEPKSFQEFENLLYSIKSKVQGLTPLALWAKGAGTLLQFNSALSCFADYQSGVYLDPNYRTGRLDSDPNDPMGPKILNKTKEMYAAGLFGSNLAGLDTNSVVTSFLNVNSVMTMLNNNDIGLVQAQLAKKNIEVGVFPIPAPEAIKDEVNYVFGGYDGFSISSSTKYVNESKKFLKFLVSKEAQQKFADTEKSVMVNKDVVYNNEAQGRLASIMKYAGKFNTYPDFKTGPNCENNNTLAVNFILGNTTQTANQLLKQLRDNTIADMNDTALNDPPAKFIKLSIPKKEFDSSWLNPRR